MIDKNEGDNKNKNSDLEKDRRLAMELEREDERKNEELLQRQEEDFIKLLGIDEEEFTNLRIEEKLRDFLYSYRFEQKTETLKKMKKVDLRDCQMKKAKKLKASE